MAAMFFGCSNLTNVDLSSFNTQKVANMWSMFGECSNLKNIDLSSFKIQNDTNMLNMFDECFNLKEIKIKKNFVEKIKKVVDEKKIKIKYNE